MAAVAAALAQLGQTEQLLGSAVMVALVYIILYPVQMLLMPVGVEVHPTNRTPQGREGQAEGAPEKSPTSDQGPLVLLTQAAVAAVVVEIMVAVQVVQA